MNQGITTSKTINDQINHHHSLMQHSSSIDKDNNVGSKLSAKGKASNLVGATGLVRQKNQNLSLNYASQGSSSQVNVYHHQHISSSGNINHGM